MTEQFNIIEEYLDGCLKEKEAQQFVKEKENNQELANEFNLRYEINQAIMDKGLMELRKKLEKQRKDYSLNYPFLNIRRDLIKTWHVAAASFALILVTGGLWYMLSSKTYPTEELAIKYYKPAHPIKQFRSVGMSSNEALQNAFNCYKQKDYETALLYFSTLKSQITAKLYSGICYIELGQYDNAIGSFEFVINDNNNLFVEQADWYLGLIYLMNKQKDKAIEQFNKISESESYYASQAEDILEYLQ